MSKQAVDAANEVEKTMEYLEQLETAHENPYEVLIIKSRLTNQISLLVELVRADNKPEVVERPKRCTTPNCFAPPYRRGLCKDCWGETYCGTEECDEKAFQDTGKCGHCLRSNADLTDIGRTEYQRFLAAQAGGQ